MDPESMIAMKPIRIRNFSNRLKYLKIHHSKEYKFGRFQARIITRNHLNDKFNRIVKISLQIKIVLNFNRVIVKGAGGGLGSGGVGSSRGALAVSVLELHKDEEIYFLIGQKGEHACIKSMGYRDKECEPKDNDSPDQPRNSKTKQVKNMVIEDGAGGGGGASYVFVVNSMNEVIPLVVAAGGGGLGIGRYLDDHDQHGRIVDPNGIDVSGEMIGEMNKTGGPGGGWRAHDDYALNINMGASLLEGSRGGIPCYPARGIHGKNFYCQNHC